MPKARGFSLLEILVVLAILAGMACILFSVLSENAERARETRCMHNLRELHQGFLLYAGDHNGLFPFGKVMDPETGQVLQNKGSYTADEYAVAFKAYIPGGRPGSSTGYREPYLCPADFVNRAGHGPTGRYGHSYGSNDYIVDKNQSLQWSNAHNTFLLADSINKFIYKTQPNNNLDPRHRQGVNVLFCDGHVEWKLAPFPTFSEDRTFWDPTR